MTQPDLPAEIIAPESRCARRGRLRRPLGLRTDAVLSQDEQRRIEELATFDFTLVRRRLIQQGSLSEEWADVAILEFRRYLALRLLSPSPVMMLSPVVDEVWHASILLTRVYADLCQRILGHFLHHDPEMQPIADASTEWRVFEERYTALFGPPGALWQAWQPWSDTETSKEGDQWGTDSQNLGLSSISRTPAQVIPSRGRRNLRAPCPRPSTAGPFDRPS